MMAPSSQMLTHGGILTRDWFSDKLVERQVEINQRRWTRHGGTYMEICSVFDEKRPWKLMEDLNHS